MPTFSNWNDANAYTTSQYGSPRPTIDQVNAAKGGFGQGGAGLASYYGSTGQQVPYGSTAAAYMQQQAMNQPAPGTTGGGLPRVMGAPGRPRGFGGVPGGAVGTNQRLGAPTGVGGGMGGGLTMGSTGLPGGKFPYMGVPEGGSMNMGQNWGSSSNMGTSNSSGMSQSNSQSGTEMVGGMLGVYNQLLGLNTKNYQNVLDAYGLGQKNLGQNLPGITGGYNALQKGVFDTLGVSGGGWGVADPAAKDIKSNMIAAQGASKQQAASAGLGNTTAAMQSQNQIASQANRAYGDLGAKLASTAAGYQSGIGQAGLGAAMQGLGMQTGLTQAGMQAMGQQFGNTAGQLTGSFGSSNSSSQNQASSQNMGQSQNFGWNQGGSQQYKPPPPSSYANSYGGGVRPGGGIRPGPQGGPSGAFNLYPGAGTGRVGGGVQVGPRIELGGRPIYENPPPIDYGGSQYENDLSGYQFPTANAYGNQGGQTAAGGVQVGGASEANPWYLTAPALNSGNGWSDNYLDNAYDPYSDLGGQWQMDNAGDGAMAAFGLF